MKPYIHKVQYYETDKMQFTHHSNYIRFMEEARIDLMEQLGWGYDKMEQEQIISPVLGVTCQYKKSTSYPDVIKIMVTVKKQYPEFYSALETMTIVQENENR